MARLACDELVTALNPGPRLAGIARNGTAAPGRGFAATSPANTVISS